MFQPGNRWLETHANLMRAGRANVQEQVFRLRASRHPFPLVFLSSGCVALMAPWGACARYGGASAAAFHRTSLLDALSQKCDWEPWTGVL